MGPAKKHPKHRGSAKPESTESFILVRLLKQCGKRKDLGAGIELHGKAAASIDKNPYVGNALISMYAKCGSISRAQRVFDELRVQDVVAWNSLIAGYVLNDRAQEAIACFDAMRERGPCRDDVTLISALNACSKARSLEKGRWIHDGIIAQSIGSLRNIALGNALLDKY
jgi:pentatricopeptide repeat protein